jgi:hypothetical protein
MRAASLWELGQQILGPFVVAHLARSEMQKNWLSGLIADGVQLGV